MLELFEAWISSTLSFAPALIFAALGAVVSERAGVVSVGVEGMMRVGAFVAAVAALSVPTPVGVVAGMLAAAAFAGIHAYLCIRWRADRIVSSMALNLLALAGGTFLLETLYSPTGTPSVPQLSRWTVDALADVPVVRVLLGHSALTYGALLTALAVHVVYRHTPWGLRVRAVGEHPAAVATAGLSVRGLRYVCVLLCGLLAGLGGASLSTSTLDRFEHHMPAGLGFMAVAAMVFGRWTPLGALGAALFFAAANALRIGLATSLPGLLEVIPQGFLLALPYLLTLVVLAVQGRRSPAPGAIGVAYEPEAR